MQETEAATGHDQPCPPLASVLAADATYAGRHKVLRPTAGLRFAAIPEVVSLTVTPIDWKKAATADHVDSKPFSPAFLGAVLQHGITTMGHLSHKAHGQAPPLFSVAGGRHDEDTTNEFCKGGLIELKDSVAVLTKSTTLLTSEAPALTYFYANHVASKLSGPDFLEAVLKHGITTDQHLNRRAHGQSLPMFYVAGVRHDNETTQEVYKGGLVELQDFSAIFKERAHFFTSGVPVLTYLHTDHVMSKLSGPDLVEAVLKHGTTTMGHLNHRAHDQALPLFSVAGNHPDVETTQEVYKDGLVELQDFNAVFKRTARIFSSGMPVLTYLYTNHVATKLSGSDFLEAVLKHGVATMDHFDNKAHGQSLPLFSVASVNNVEVTAQEFYYGGLVELENSVAVFRAGATLFTSGVPVLNYLYANHVSSTLPGRNLVDAVLKQAITTIDHLNRRAHGQALPLFSVDTIHHDKETTQEGYKGGLVELQDFSAIFKERADIFTPGVPVLSYLYADHVASKLLGHDFLEAVLKHSINTTVHSDRKAHAQVPPLFSLASAYHDEGTAKEFYNVWLVELENSVAVFRDGATLFTSGVPVVNYLHANHVASKLFGRNLVDAVLKQGITTIDYLNHRAHGQALPLFSVAGVYHDKETTQEVYKGGLDELQDFSSVFKERAHRFDSGVPVLNYPYSGHMAGKLPCHDFFEAVLKHDIITVTHLNHRVYDQSSNINHTFSPPVLASSIDRERHTTLGTHSDGAMATAPSHGVYVSTEITPPTPAIVSMLAVVSVLQDTVGQTLHEPLVTPVALNDVGAHHVS